MPPVHLTYSTPSYFSPSIPTVAWKKFDRQINEEEKSVFFSTRQEAGDLTRAQECSEYSYQLLHWMLVCIKCADDEFRFVGSSVA